MSFDMENTEFDNQSRAYSNYVSYFNPDLKWITTIYKDLYDILDKDLNFTIVSLGDYFLEKLLVNLSENLIRIENEVNIYSQNNNYSTIQREHIFYYKSFLENRINELFKEYNLKKKTKIKEEKEDVITYYDKILKELQVIDIIFKSQMNPEIHLGSGVGLARYCNEIFIISDFELLKISDYKRQYTLRLEQSNNNSLVANELKNIHNQSVELYNFYLQNLYNHPDKKEFFIGQDSKQQIINSTGYYNFINYKIRFHFFEVEQNSEVMSTINLNLFKNCFKYNCKNETLINFCVQLLDFIKLSDVLVKEDTTSITSRNHIYSETENKNPFPRIFTGDNNKTFTLFEAFTNNHIIDKYIDFSFIFQQMKHNGYILDIKHLKFMEWLNKNNYLTEKEYEDFKVKNSFRSLSKCAVGTRLNLYYKLQEDIITSSSD